MMLPVLLTTLSRAFENTGVDFAGPFEFKIVTGNFGRAYLALFTCAIWKSVYLDLVTTQKDLKPLQNGSRNKTVILTQCLQNYK